MRKNTKVFPPLPPSLSLFPSLLSLSLSFSLTPIPLPFFLNVTFSPIPRVLGSVEYYCRVPKQRAYYTQSMALITVYAYTIFVHSQYLCTAKGQSNDFTLCITHVGVSTNMYGVYTSQGSIQDFLLGGVEKIDHRYM